MSCQSMLCRAVPPHLEVGNAILRDLVLIQLQPLKLGEPSNGFGYGDCTHPPNLHVHSAAITHSSASSATPACSAQHDSLACLAAWMTSTLPEKPEAAVGFAIRERLGACSELRAERALDETVSKQRRSDGKAPTDLVL